MKLYSENSVLFEFFNLTQFSSASLVQIVRTGVDLKMELPAFDVNPPDNLADANRYWERHEGMRAQVPADSVVIDSRQMFRQYCGRGIPAGS